MRKVWFETSYILDQKQSGEEKAKERFDNYTKQPLNFKFPYHFTGKLPVFEKIIVGLKQQSLEKKDQILNEKWLMQCIWQVLMLKMYI